MIPGDGSAEWDEAEWGGPSFGLHLPRHDPGEPEALTVPRLPTERERVGAELVAYRDRDGGDPEWHVDVIDRDRVETLLSLLVGQAMMLRAQIDIAIRDALAHQEAAGLRPVGPAYRSPAQRGLGPDHQVHDESGEDPAGVSWSLDDPGTEYGT